MSLSRVLTILAIAVAGALCTLVAVRGPGDLVPKASELAADGRGRPTSAADGAVDELAAVVGNERRRDSVLLQESPSSAAVDAAPWGFPGDREGALEGVVVGTGGQPVAGAQLQVLYYEQGDYIMLDSTRAAQATSLARSTSDAAGQFRIRVPADRAVAVVCKSPGYGPAEVSPAFAGESVVIRLKLAATAAGSVAAKATGAVLAGSAVELWKQRAVRLVSSTMTNDQGAFQFADVGAGDYFLRVRSPGYEASAALFSARAEEDYHHRFELEAARHFRGRVVDEATGIGIPKARVSTDWLNGKAVECSSDGSFEHAWSPRARIFARADGYGGGASAMPALDQAGRAEPVEIRLRRGRTVMGTVVDAAGAPLGGVYVAGVSTDIGPAHQMVDWQSATSQADGRFELNTLNVFGHHVLMFQLPGFGSRLLDLPSTELNEDEIDVGQVELQPGRVVGGRVIAASGGPLAGVVVSLQGYSAERNRLWPSDHEEFAPPKALIRHTVSDMGGRYRFVDVAAGSYILRSRLRKGAPEFGEPILVEDAGADLDVLIVHDQGQSIEGRVVDAAAAPLSGMEVRVMNEATPGQPPIIIGTYPSGQFTVTDLPPGTYTVTARPTYTNHGRAIPLAASSVSGVYPGEVGLDLILKPAATLGGRLMDSDGSPVEGRTVLAQGVGGLLDETLTDRAGAFILAVPAQAEVSLEVVDGPLTKAVSAVAGDRNVLLVLADR